MGNVLLNPHGDVALGEKISRQEHAQEHEGGKQMSYYSILLQAALVTAQGVSLQHADAEDAAQDALLAMIEARKDGQLWSPAWTGGTARNKALQIRHKAYRRATQELDATQAAPDAIPGNEFQEAYDRALCDFTPLEQQALEMWIVDGDKFQARELLRYWVLCGASGYPGAMSTAERHLNRLRARLQHILKDWSPEA